MDEKINIYLDRYMTKKWFRILRRCGSFIFGGNYAVGGTTMWCGS